MTLKLVTFCLSLAIFTVCLSQSQTAFAPFKLLPDDTLQYKVTPAQGALPNAPKPKGLVTEINLSHVLKDLIEVQHESNVHSAAFKEGIG